MNALKTLPALYEDLANYFARQGDSRGRDQCMLLAADAALSAGMPQEAERLRKRLLLTNPHHMLRPYASMTEALQSNDVRDYVLDLRRQWPPESVEKMLNQGSAAASGQGTAPKPASVKAPARKANEPPAETPIRFGAYLLWLIVMAAGILLAGALLFTALVWPMLE